MPLHETPLNARIICGAVWARLHAPDVLLHRVQEALSVENPNAKYTKAAKYGRWDGKVKFFRRPSNSFLAGLTSRVATLLKAEGAQVEVSELPAHLGACLAPRLKGLDLRPYQERAVHEALKHRRIALHAPTGAGKSEMGMEIIRCAGRPALWVTHSKGLLYQTQKRFEARLPEVSVGLIGDGHMEPDGDVAIGMVQTLSKMLKVKEFWSQWDVLIMDEAHHAGATTWMKVAQACERAWMRVGLSGTLKTRAPDPIRLLRIEGVLGPTLVVEETMPLARQGFLRRPHLVILHPPLESYPGYETIRQAVWPGWRHDPRKLSTMGHRLFALTYELGIVKNTARNRLLLSTAYRHVSGGDKTLLLLTRIPHAHALHKLWQTRVSATPGIFPAWALDGHASSDERQQALDAFRSARKGALLIATPFFREGMDLPEIDVALLGGGGESEIAVLQGLGRALRPRPDRDEVLIYDVADGPGTHDKDYLANHFQERLTTYRTHGFEVSL